MIRARRPGGVRSLSTQIALPEWIFKGYKVINRALTLSDRQKCTAVMVIIWNLIIKNKSRRDDKGPAGPAPRSICGNQNANINESLCRDLRSRVAGIRLCQPRAPRYAISAYLGDINQR